MWYVNRVCLFSPAYVCVCVCVCARAGFGGHPLDAPMQPVTEVRDNLQRN